MTLVGPASRGGRTAVAGLGRDEQAWRDWLAGAMVVTPERLQHSLAVWERARRAVDRELCWLPVERAATLTLAALLHDAGRAVDPGNTEPHGVAGARLLDTAGLPDVAALVAHHSGGRFEAWLRGHDGFDRWAGVDPDLLAVLTYLDRTTSSTGEETSIADRRANLVERYGPGSLNVVTFDLAMPDVVRGRELLHRRPERAAG